MLTDGLVLDASVLINILGSGVADRVLGAVSTRRIVADVTSREVIRDPRIPTGRADPLEALLRANLIERVGLTPVMLETFIKLVGAEPPNELGDGEAAAIALAHELRLPIALDDAKARRVVREAFPVLAVPSSVDLFALPSVASALGAGLADAVFSALIHARMRVLPENTPWVRLLLGDRAAQCPSLKKRKK